MKLRAALPAIAATVLIVCLIPQLVQAQVYGASCPTNIDADDCVANDLQPTGTEIINGPSQCNEGDIFSATVRILFEDGGGANARYTVGFFVGENGESAVGGASCTFDSLQPVATSPALVNPQGGPYAELSGDLCGDIAKREPTYKDIQLNSIECKDDDGDGNVDVSYVLSWENNANQTDCGDPLDPGEFDPDPPKCRSDLEYDLPIGVEDPPSIEVAKGAFPSQLPEPGGVVRFPITVINTSPASTDPVEIVSIIDKVEDQPAQEISGLVDCVLPFVLAPGLSKTCNYVSSVSGAAGDTITDTVTVFGRDDEGQGVQDSDSATVTIIGADPPPLPGDLRLVKFASPSKVDEPGGTVQYDVLVANVSTTPVELTSLEDDLYGNLNGKGSCVLPQILSGLNSVYFCAFEEQVLGQPGDVIIDTITARGFDNLPTRTPLEAEDSARVEIDNVPSDIAVKKTAQPEVVREPGGNVEFTLEIQNNSVTDSVVIESLFDSQLGVPGGDCSTPQTLQKNGDTYTCSYSGLVSGDAGDTITNVVTALGIDDDGDIVSGLAAATVTIADTEPSVAVRKVAVPPFALEGGSPVLFVVAIQNTSNSTDPLTIIDLYDESPSGLLPLNGEGSCNIDDLVLQPAPDPNSFYICSFSQTLSGTAGESVVDTVTVVAEDDEGIDVSASAMATVDIIAVSPPDAPAITIAKIASPLEILEPSDTVAFSIYIANTGDPNNPNLDVTLNTLVDSVYGNLFVYSDGDCNALDGQTLSPGDVVFCRFTATVSGDAGDTHQNIVTVTGTAPDLIINNTVEASDDATVQILKAPAAIEVSKYAQPTTVIEPGEDVLFTVIVRNTSSNDAIRIQSLIDNVHGDLLATNQCPQPPVLFPGRDPYVCQFTAFVGGTSGFEERNTVVAVGLDDDDVEVEGRSQATVTVQGTPPSIITTKTANPGSVPASGGRVSFTFTTTNTSSVDVVTLETLNDNVFGDLNGKGDCEVPQDLQPGASYSCVFSTTLSGVLGETHLDEVTVTGTSDDGEPVASRANAIVRFVAMMQSIPTLGQFGLGSLILLTGWIGWRRLSAR